MTLVEKTGSICVKNETKIEIAISSFFFHLWNKFAKYKRSASWLIIYAFIDKYILIAQKHNALLLSWLDCKVYCSSGTVIKMTNANDNKKKSNLNFAL